ncbi:MAG: gliding motility protein GldN [Prevotella sp.]|nr:gliding motility protein GldN [Prevotella sp.]
MKRLKTNRYACLLTGRVVLLLLLLACLPLVAGAQPKKSRVQQTEKNAKKQKSPSSAMSMRAQLTFPTALEVPEDVVWRRDIYREINLEDDPNAGLYYPVEPQGKDVNLFTYIFKLAQNGYLPVYEYPTDGSDNFADNNRVEMKTVLDNYHIFYEEQDGKLKVDNSDIPSAEVKKYYLKESAYYNQANSSFHIKVLALCPVMMREDDFGGEATNYPLFWVKYSDLEPFLNRQTVMTSSLNNAATMSMDDFFTLNKYRGKIYKTTNMLGKTLAQVCGGDSAKLSSEQKRIEAELESFRKNIFGDPARRDSLDSIANANPQNVKAAKKLKAKKERRNRSRRTKVSGAKTSTSSSSSSTGAARVSVRRQRH